MMKLKNETRQYIASVKNQYICLSKKAHVRMRVCVGCLTAVVALGLAMNRLASEFSSWFVGVVKCSITFQFRIVGCHDNDQPKK